MNSEGEMLPAWVGCAVCDRHSQTGLLLTNCGHIFCAQCKPVEDCKVCGRKSIKFLAITADIRSNPQVGHLFCDIKDSIIQILDVVNFRDMHYALVQAHLRKHPVNSQRSSQQQVAAKRKALESDIKEAEKLVKLLRAQGLRDKDTLSHITASGKTIDLKPILQQSVKLLNSTKPGANVLATPLQTSQLHTPHHTPSSRPHHTSTTPQHRPHSARTTAPSITSVSMATPSSGCYAAYGSAIRSARSTTVTLHTKRHHTSHTSTSDTPHSFNLSTFSGSAARRPLSQQRSLMPPPPAPPTLTFPTAPPSATIVPGSASPRDLSSSAKRRTPSCITPSPHIYPTPQSMQQTSGGRSAGARSMERLSYPSPSPHMTRKRPFVTPDSGGRLSLRARPSGGRLVPLTLSPMSQGTTHTPLRMNW